MEEMFPEEKIAEHRAVKRRMRRAGIATKIADGEGHRGGIPEKLLAERFEAEEGEGESGPLFDINQPDMNENGFLRMRALAALSARHDLTIAPHNFGSKMGFWSQVHLGLTAANWEFSETDDSAFPALEAPGIRIERGLASITGEPGLGVTLREEKLEKPILALEA
jgi:L-alanine-DL-glutamate epimerase-like enolase superfamily enzyme